MKYFKFTSVFCLVLLFLAVSCFGHNRDGKCGNGNSLQKITTCNGQPLDLKSLLEVPTQKCLDARIQEAQNQTEQNANENKGKKKGMFQKVKDKISKKMEKISKRMNKKCLPECEWKTFGLIPDVGNNSKTYPPVQISDAFLKSFPEKSREGLKIGMTRCYNRTEPMYHKVRKMGPVQKMCMTNMRLVKCLLNTVRRTCRGNGGTRPSTPGTGGVNAPTRKPGRGNVTTTTDPSDDAFENTTDDDKDLNEKDDEEESTTVGSKVKSTPHTHVDTSKQIT